MNEYFEEERFWLENQEGMKPWEKGKVHLETKIKTCVEETIAAFFNDAQISYRPNDFLPRFWACVNYHWRQFAGGQHSISFEDVMKKLKESNRGDGNSPFVRPNVRKNESIAQTTFPDVAYTVFYANNHTDAGGNAMKSYYIPRCYQIACAKARSHYAGSHFANDYQEPVWGEYFEMHLKDDTTTETGNIRIFSYSGRSNLMAWLVITAWTYTRQHLIEFDSDFIGKKLPVIPLGSDDEDFGCGDIEDKKTLTPEEEAIRKEEETAGKEEQNENEKIMKEVVVYIETRINGFPDPKDKYIAKRYCYDKNTLEQIGKEIHLHKGTVSRKLSRIRREIYDGLNQDFGDGYRMHFPASTKDEKEKYMKQILKIFRDIFDENGENIKEPNP